MRVSAARGAVLAAACAEAVAWAGQINIHRRYMVSAILRFVVCYILPPGRGIHALERVAAMATALGLDAIAAHAQLAIAEYRKVKAMQIRMRVGSTSLYGPDTPEIDALLDRGLASVDGYLDSQITLYPREHARSVAASVIRPALFPEGVRAITRQSYVQQRVDVDQMLETFASPELAAARAELPDLGLMMDQVAELNVRYGDSIDAYDRDRPNHERVRAAQELAHTMLLETVVLILAAYVQSAPEMREGVAALLGPIERQNDAVRANRRRRRPPTDIDPGTGIELPEDEQPIELPEDEVPEELPEDEVPEELSA
jgi:hypothetical protein